MPTPIPRVTAAISIESLFNNAEACAEGIEPAPLGSSRPLSLSLSPAGRTRKRFFRVSTKCHLAWNLAAGGSSLTSYTEQGRG
ncbi:unnamed protein product [Diplocarpon coronariae]